MTVAGVEMWGTRIGAVRWDAEQELGFFEYTPAFRESGIEVAPVHMPLSPAIYSFPALARESFHGLPGMLADVLPDRFGNALIDAWLAAQGRSAQSFNPVERLCYTGSRGMGALEFRPVHDAGGPPQQALDVAALVSLADRILHERDAFSASLADGAQAQGVQHILRVGTSAGGARAKAVIAWNPQSNEVRSGEADIAAGFEPWVLKFDGVRSNRDHELAQPMGYGLIEYAYHKMAVAAGIDMSPCRIFAEGGRHHFMTRRFDRTASGGRLHMQSLCALGHLDFQQAGAHSYEQAMLLMRRLSLPMAAIEQQFRRMVFNILARNQDDHSKNIALLMNRQGQWSLSPAFDVTYSYNPEGAWTSRHQMSAHGKTMDFTLADLEAVAQTVAMKRGRAAAIHAEVQAAVAQWPCLAAAAGVTEETAQSIGAAHRCLR